MSPDKIKLALDRIEFVKRLGTLDHYFKGEHLIEHIGNGWTHPFQHYEGLTYYLILTCFDILGQKQKFEDFPNWLKAKEVKEERDKIIESVNSLNLPLIQALRKVHEGYIDIYGAIKSFKRFIEETISTANRNKLFDSIQLFRFDKRSQMNVDLEENELKKAKLKLLQDIRNNFTHNGISLASPAGGVFNKINNISITQGINKTNEYFNHLYTEDAKNHKTSYLVKEWPKTLIDIILDTINENSNEETKAFIMQSLKKEELIQSEAFYKNVINEIILLNQEMESVTNQMMLIVDFVNKFKSKINYVDSERLKESINFSSNPLSIALAEIINKTVTTDLLVILFNGSIPIYIQSNFSIFEEIRKIRNKSHFLENSVTLSNYKLNLDIHQPIQFLETLQSLNYFGFDYLLAKIETKENVFNLFSVIIKDKQFHPQEVLGFLFTIRQDIEVLIKELKLSFIEKI
jgi:hypothetical protein